MSSDLISRSALKKDLLDRSFFPVIVKNALEKAPAVDAVELPKGRPGDYLEWDNGAGFRQIYGISSVMICEDCMRYELASFAPVVDHPNIVSIMSKEEAEKMIAERRKQERSTTAPTAGRRWRGEGCGK